MMHLLRQRLVAIVPVMLLVSFGVFVLVSLVPGDPAVSLAGGVDATPEKIAEVREQLHLDEPLVAQYARWLSGVLRFDFGDSLTTRTPVADDVLHRLPVTVGLVLASAAVALVIGIPLGILAGLRSGGRTDRASSVVASVSVAIPSFCLAPMLVILFAVRASWLPPSGYVQFSDSALEWARHMVMPAVTLGLFLSASLARQLRASLIDVLDSNYVRTVRAAGGTGQSVLKHSLRNASVPAITVFGVQIGQLLGGSVIVEQIFSVPGLGTYLLRAISVGDVVAVQAVTVVFILCQLTVSLLVDVAHAALDPRVRT